MGERGAWLGAIVALAMIGGANMLQGGPSVAEAEPEGDPVCTMDLGAVRMAAKADPGLAPPSKVAAVPIYRSYVPARLHVLVCPATDACSLPEEVPVDLFTGVGPEPLHKHDAVPEILSRGRCIEMAWSGRADSFWPHAPEGVVRWAVVIDSDGRPKRPMDWHREGRVQWVGEVVYAGTDGSPSVH